MKGLRFAVVQPLLAAGAWMLVSALASAAEKTSTTSSIQFRVERASVVSVNLYGPDGSLARRLVQAQRFPKGTHQIAWDGQADDGNPVNPGEYTWRGIVHEGVGLKLRGWAANGAATPWPTADGKGDWGGDTGVPSAVTADERQVYLGWSLAEQGNAILACDLDGKIQWAHRRAEGASGCKALGTDAGLVFVLGGLAGLDAEGGSIYRLDAKDGKPVPWPNGQVDLKIVSFWPAKVGAPRKADAMAVRNDRIYLSFADSEFLAVLDARTGAYLETVVGASTTAIDATATMTALPGAPGKPVAADFALVAVTGGMLVKVLFAHDPTWVIDSDLVAAVQEMRINALTVIPDTAKFHRQEAFIAAGRPYHQIQGRPLVDTESLIWLAGKTGGRPLLGPWEAKAFRDIRALAMAVDGKLWVAEGDAFPKRVSVWDTTGQQGQLVREFFGPMDLHGGAAAINPLDPNLMFAQGCEWRIDRETGQAKCLGTVFREPVKSARFGVGENGRAYLVLEEMRGWVHIFERAGDGDFRLRTQIYSAAENGTPTPQESAVKTVLWADENDDGVAQPDERRAVPGIVRLHIAATLQDMALTGTTSVATTRIFPVEDWTACGAPRYDLAAGKEADAGQPSADGKLQLSSGISAAGLALACRTIGAPSPRWNLPLGAAAEPTVMAGVAKLPDPVRNVWLLSREHAPWLLLNEDGFEIARFFAPNAKDVAWPKSAVPGADMTLAQAGKQGGLTQAIDGKLYLQAGTSAAWNLEVTGLEKVRELKGGSLVVPPQK